MNFFNGFSRNNPISEFMKICPVGVQFFHDDGQIDGHDEANSSFLQFYA